MFGLACLFCNILRGNKGLQGPSYKGALIRYKLRGVKFHAKVAQNFGFYPGDKRLCYVPDPKLHDSSYLYYKKSLTLSSESCF